MNGLLSFFLAGATLAGAVEDQAPKPKIDVSAQIYMPDGKASGASRRIDLGTEPVVLYVYTGKTLCEARTVSAEKPIVAGNGWKLELAPAPGTPTAKGAAVVKATWQRMWEGGKPVTTIQANSRSITVSPGNPVPLDTIDGAARHTIAKPQQWKRGDPIPTEFQHDPIVEALSARIEAGRNEIRRMKAEQGFGDGHPKVVQARSDLEWAENRRDTQVLSLIDGKTTGGTSVDGCAALSMNLQVQAAEPAGGDLAETEIWLVHRDPAGKETTQRQVIRSRGNADATFYFDDTKVMTDGGSMNVEMYGSLSLGSCCGGKLFPTIHLTRRYSTTDPKVPWKTRGGSGTYQPQSVDGEIVSLQLPPLSDDDGALAGHRFSLRVRVKVLQ
ncbi:MAG: hypothetical protein WCQ64_15920 [Acidobacteriota bacterium]